MLAQAAEEGMRAVGEFLMKPRLPQDRLGGQGAPRARGLAEAVSLQQEKK